MKIFMIVSGWEGQGERRVYELKYNYDDEAIYIIKNGTTTLVNDEYPSEPTVSPNKIHSVFVAPLEWECLGSLYLFSHETGEVKKIIEPSLESKIPKKAIWINNEWLAVIIGYGHGTVAIGGNIYLFNIKNNELREVTNFDNTVQITDIEYNDNSGKIIGKGIKYKDSNHNSFIEYQEEFNASV